VNLIAKSAFGRQINASRVQTPTPGVRDKCVYSSRASWNKVQKPTGRQNPGVRILENLGELGFQENGREFNRIVGEVYKEAFVFWGHSDSCRREMVP
jgi:hypothetical protein